MSRIAAWPQSLAAWERSRRSLGAGVSSGLRASMPPHPLSFASGSGAHLTDVDGHRYTDYVLGWGPVFLGHAHPGVTEAVRRQAALGVTFGSGHHFEYDVAERIVAAMPGVERVLFSNTGTEAVAAALRLARAATGRERVLKCTGHYHGWQDGVLVGYRGPDATSLGEVGPQTPGQSLAAMSDVSLARFNDIASAEAALSAPGADIAAVIVEPVLMNSGVLAPVDGYLEALRELCDRAGTVLIFDQVITGFRVAFGGAAAVYGVIPDLSVLAKGLGNGYPVAAVAGRADLIDQVAGGVLHAGTYNGGPLVLAAADATLKELAETSPYERLGLLAQELASGLAEVLSARGVVGIAHAVGPVVQLALGVETLATFEDYQRADWDAYRELSVALLRRGQFVMPGGRWYLCAAHTEDDIRTTLAAVAEAVDEVAADLVPRARAGGGRVREDGGAP